MIPWMTVSTDSNDLFTNIPNNTLTPARILSSLK